MAPMQARIMKRHNVRFIRDHPLRSFGVLSAEASYDPNHSAEEMRIGVHESHVRLQDRRIVEQGTHEELMAHGALYRSLNQVQTQEELRQISLRRGRQG